MQTMSVNARFSVQPILMLSHLHTPNVRDGQDRRRKDPDSAGFNSMLKNILEVKPAAN